MSRAEAEITRKINAWYGRLAANNGISMAEAKKLLNRKELEEFRWDVNDYIKYGKENAINGQWMKQLENASARVHISRLEQLKLQVQQEAERLYGNYLDGVDRHIKTLYEEGFYKTAYEIQKGIGVGVEPDRCGFQQTGQDHPEALGGGWEEFFREDMEQQTAAD